LTIFRKYKITKTFCFYKLFGFLFRATASKVCNF